MEKKKIKTTHLSKCLQKTKQLLIRKDFFSNALFLKEEITATHENFQK